MTELRVGDRVFSPIHGDGVIVDTDYHITTRPWIHKTKVVVAWDDASIIRGYRGDPDANVHEHSYYEKRTVEQYRRLYLLAEKRGDAK